MRSFEQAAQALTEREVDRLIAQVDSCLNYSLVERVIRVRNGAGQGGMGSCGDTSGSSHNHLCVFPPKQE